LMKKNNYFKFQFPHHSHFRHCNHLNQFNNKYHSMPHFHCKQMMQH
jgi:hypothetical protein